MYNRYVPEDAQAFDELYTRVEPQQPRKEVLLNPQKKEKAHFNANQFLEKLKLNEIGLFPLMILALLLLEADEEERLIMIALAVVLGI